MRRIESDAGSVTIDVEHGARLTSIALLGREWLAPSTPVPTGTADYAREGLGGWDECAPTVGSCVVSGADYGDHGHVWNRPWVAVQHSASSLVAEVSSPVPGFTLSRRVTLAHQTLSLDYALTVTADAAVPLLWSAHPLFAAEPGSAFRLAAGTPVVHEGPDGEAVDDPEAPLGDLGVGHGRKAFAPANAPVALVHPDGSSVTVEAEGRAVNAIGLWWDHRLVAATDCMAIEPTFAATDSAASAECPVLEPGSVTGWSLSLEFSAPRSAGAP